MIAVILILSLIASSLSLTPLQSKLSALLSSDCTTKNGINLSTLTSASDYTFALGSNSILHMNVCGNTNTKCPGSYDAPIFYNYGEAAGECYQLGQLFTAEWVDNSNTLILSNGDNCPNMKGTLFSSTIHFIAGNENRIVKAQNVNGCNFDITFETNLISNNYKKSDAFITNKQASCISGTGIDYSSLTVTDGNYYDYIGANVNITMNVCAVTKNCFGSVPSPVNIIYDVNPQMTSSNCVSLGGLDTAVWNGNVLSYTYGDSYCRGQPQYHYSSDVFFTCDKNADTPYISLVKTSDSCHYSVFFNTYLAC